MSAAETFPRDYVERLRAENKELRLRAKGEKLPSANWPSGDALMTDLNIKARIAEAQDRIKRFTFTAELGNPESARIVDEARLELAELADLDVRQKEK